MSDREIVLEEAFGASDNGGDRKSCKRYRYCSRRHAANVDTGAPWSKAIGRVIQRADWTCLSGLEDHPPDLVSPAAARNRSGPPDK